MWAEALELQRELLKAQGKDAEAEEIAAEMKSRNPGRPGDSD